MKAEGGRGEYRTYGLIEAPGPVLKKGEQNDMRNNNS